MSNTSTVMIATVIIRFVAILHETVSFMAQASQSGIRDFKDVSEGGWGEQNLPTRHPPQRLHAPIHVAFALQHRNPRVLNRLSLHL